MKIINILTIICISILSISIFPIGINIFTGVSVFVMIILGYTFSLKGNKKKSENQNKISISKLIISIAIDYAFAALCILIGIIFLDLDNLSISLVFLYMSSFYLLSKNIWYQSFGFKLLSLRYIDNNENIFTSMKILMSNLIIYLPIGLFVIKHTINNESSVFIIFDYLLDFFGLILIIDLMTKIISKKKNRLIDMLLGIEILEINKLNIMKIDYHRMNNL